MTTTTARGNITKGIPGLLTPYSTSEFQAMVEAARTHHNYVHDQYVSVAAELRSGLKKATGSPGLLGLDVAIAARRVTRHLAKAGAIELEAARAAVRSYEMFTELFIGGPGRRQQGFDVNK